jgi:hypothetical protein
MIAGRWNVGGLGWRWRVAGLLAAVLLAGVLGVGRARAALPSNCSQSGEDVICSFSSTGFPDQTFQVPAGISSVNVVAVGAPGGAAGPRFPSPVPGGAGAVASGIVSVTGGQTLYVEVGGAGDAGFTDSAGGFNGGGTGDSASNPGSGGGGGASDVRTAPFSAGLGTDSRLLVAGGGGGAGAAGGPPSVRGGAGGAAGQQGLTGTPLSSLGAGGGGLPGTTSRDDNGGTGGAGGDIGGRMGSNGGLGGGGGGSTDGAGGGGGGGGLYGGGQGGEGAGDFNDGAFAAGGGGGGGSSLVPAGGAVVANTTGAPPQVKITYTAPDSTSTSVTCSPGTVAVGHASTCTSTVTDTDSSGQSTPSGSVGFTSSGSGSFSANSCTLSGSGASARCSVSYTPSSRGAGSQTITAGYGGDASHQASSGQTDLTIVVAPAAPTITALANGDAHVGVSFTDANPGTSPITSYEVTATDLSQATAPLVTAKGPSSPVTVTGLTTGDTCVFTVTATSADGTSPPSAPSARLNVGVAPVIQSGPADGVVGQAYSSRFVVSGAPPATVTQISGEVPPGLTLSSDGTLVGTLTQGGTYEFTVEAVNPVGDQLCERHGDDRAGAGRTTPGAPGAPAAPSPSPSSSPPPPPPPPPPPREKLGEELGSCSTTRSAVIRAWCSERANEGSDSSLMRDEPLDEFRAPAHDLERAGSHVSAGPVLRSSDNRWRGRNAPIAAAPWR